MNNRILLTLVLITISICLIASTQGIRVLQSSSSYMPEIVDDSSSPTTVFVRTNITSEELTDDEGNTYTRYRFTETFYPRVVYNQMVADGNTPWLEEVQ